MPEYPAKPTLAEAAQGSNLDKAANTIALTVVSDAINRCLSDPSVGWFASLSTAIVAAGVVSPLTIGAVLVLASSLKIRQTLSDRKQATKIQEALRHEANQQNQILDVLHRLDDGSLQIGLDPFALEDIKEIVRASSDNQAPKFRDGVRNEFDSLWTEYISHVDQLIQDQHDLTRDHQDRVAERLEAQIQSTPHEVVEAWKQSELSAYLVIPCLIGGWLDKNVHDQSVIDRLLESDREKFDAAMRDAVQIEGAPIAHRDGVWRVPDRIALWKAIGPRVFDEDLDRLRKVAEDVLGQRDPQFDLPEDERWLANIKGKILPHSQVLRNGIIHTLAMLGSRPNELQHCSHEKPQGVAFAVIRNMLSDLDWQRWGSLNHLLPTLAEASPEAFLEAVEHAMEADPCPFDRLFAEEGSGFTGANYLTGLWWALEKLAWHSDYLVRVASILGRLDKRDPGGNWGNRPGNSLKTILTPWLPQTAAPISKCVVAIRAVLSDAPQAGWKLLLKLLPGDHDHQSPTQRPIYRQWELPNESWRPTRQVIVEAYTNYSAIAVEFCRDDPAKIAELIPRLGKLAESDASLINSYLLSDSTDHFDSDSKRMLWETVTSTLRKHDRSPDAKWRWPNEQLDQLRKVGEKLRPRDPADRHRYLFVSWGHDLYDGKGDYADQERRLTERRDTALAEVMSSGGIDDVLRLARISESAAQVGFVFGRSIYSADFDNTLLNWISSEDELESEFARGFLLSRINAGGWDWLDSLGINDWPIELRVKLLCWLSFVPNTWERAGLWLGNESSDYWKKCPVNAYAHDGDLMPAVEKLRQYDRSMQALTCLHCMIERDWFDAEILIATLLEAATSKESPPSQFGYHVEQLIERLQKDDEIDRTRLGTVEWAYLPLFGNGNGGKPKSLELGLAQDPHFYCELIRTMFRSRNPGEQNVEIPDENKEGLGTRIWSLLQEWSTPPGILEDGSFDSSACAAWFDTVRSSLESSGHLETGLHMAGAVLVHFPSDPNGLWLHRGAAAVINRADMEELRRGYDIGIHNSRGVHHVANDGSGEDALANKWYERAEAVENAGFHRLATTLRGVAQDYRREAEQVRRRFEDDLLD